MSHNSALPMFQTSGSIQNVELDTSYNSQRAQFCRTPPDVVIPVSMGLIRVAFVSVAQLHVLPSWGLGNVSAVLSPSHPKF